MLKHQQNLILHYREELDKRRRLFYQHSNMPTAPHDATRKFSTKGEVKPFHGWSIVYFLTTQNTIFNRLQDMTISIKNSLESAGVVNKFAFLPVSTFHITIVGIVTNPSDAMSEDIVKGVKECFANLSSENILAPSLVVRGDISPDGSTIIAPIEPSNVESLETLYYIRNEVRKKLHPLGNNIVKNTPHNFHGHISLAYMIKPFRDEEYAKFKDIFRSYSNKEDLGELTVNTISLYNFKSMTEWGAPVLTMSLK